jgi:hypothetical protein
MVNVLIITSKSMLSGSRHVADTTLLNQENTHWILMLKWFSRKYLMKIISTTGDLQFACSSQNHRLPAGRDLGQPYAGWHEFAEQ